MATDPDTRPHAWLQGSAMRAASDASLGVVLLIAGAVAVLVAGGLGLGRGADLGPGSYPLAVGWLLLAVGVAALLRAAVLRNVDHTRWSLTGIVIITAIVLAAQFAVQQWGLDYALRFGPPDFAAIMVLEFAVVIALARASRIRAAGMVLLGLLIAIIGIDLSSGIERFTMGINSLSDGIPVTTAVLGFAAADGALCVASPSLLLASYARKVGHRLAAGPRLPVDLLLRLAGALLVAAALYAAYVLEGSGWPVGQIAVFAALGIACQIFDWNRLVLLIAMMLGPLLEENVRRTLLISRGDLTIYLNRPIAGTVLLLAIAVLTVAVLLSAWLTLAKRRQASG